MKLISIIVKGLKEQVRSYWILLLSISMGPFFVFVYYLITETSKPQYNILVLNNDKGVVEDGKNINHGKSLTDFFRVLKIDTIALPFKVQVISDRTNGIERIQNKKADALIIINDSFSKDIEAQKLNESAVAPIVEFTGDLTNTNYLISAVFANEFINEYTYQVKNTKRIVMVKETALGNSGNISSFDMIVPGIMIVSLIMLMFTASIAFVAEIENKTIVRLKLSKLKTFEFLGGISIVQMLVGIFSVLLTLITANLLGFHYSGSLWVMTFIAGLTSFSIIAFSLIIAAFTKSANEVLVVGNFPMFLFMFFTGAAFPLKSNALFTIAGYPINIQGLMTPTHAISALNKTFVMNMNLTAILPEITVIILLTVFYFLIGAIFFRRRHLKLTN